MEAVKTFGISICTVLIIASIFSMIMPNISQKNVVKILISAFILSGMLYSIAEFISDSNSSFVSAFTFETIDAKDEKIKYPDKIVDKLEECTVNAL